MLNTSCYVCGGSDSGAPPRVCFRCRERLGLGISQDFYFSRLCYICDADTGSCLLNRGKVRVCLDCDSRFPGAAVSVAEVSDSVVDDSLFQDTDFSFGDFS